MAEGHGSQGGSGGLPPGNVLKQICAEMQIWCILRHSLVHFETQSYSVLRQGNLTSCALTSARLDDFSDIVTYIL